MNGLNLENEEYCQEKEIFEEEKTIKELDKINYIRYKNGKIRIKTKLDDNIYRETIIRTLIFDIYIALIFKFIK